MGETVISLSQGSRYLDTSMSLHRIRRLNANNVPVMSAGTTKTTEGGRCTWKVTSPGIFTIRAEPNIHVWFVIKKTFEVLWISKFQMFRIEKAVTNKQDLDAAAASVLSGPPTPDERLLAIISSIEHWRSIGNLVKTDNKIHKLLKVSEVHDLSDILGFRVKSRVCALCHVYLEQRCHGCPLYQCDSLGSTWLEIVHASKAKSALRAIRSLLTKLDNTAQADCEGWHATRI